MRTSDKTKTNLGVDAVLFATLVLAIVSHEAGPKIHQWIGIAMLVVVVIHLVMHRKWIVAVIRRYSELPHRTRVHAWSDAALMAAFALTAVSGLANSPLLVGGRAHARSSHVHHASVVLFIVAVLVHLALHWKWIRKAIQRYVLNETADQ